MKIFDYLIKVNKSFFIGIVACLLEWLNVIPKKILTGFVKLPSYNLIINVCYFLFLFVFFRKSNQKFMKTRIKRVGSKVSSLFEKWAYLFFGIAVITATHFSFTGEVGSNLKLCLIAIIYSIIFYYHYWLFKQLVNSLTT